MTMLCSCGFSPPGLSVPWILACRGVTGLVREVDTPSARLRRAFETLGLVQDHCTQQDIREAYLRLAKRYHPDSTLEANTDQFILIREAYKQCTSYAKNVALTREIHRAMEEELQNMDRTLGLRRHRQLAHRRYLQYDGVGPGTTSERQRAHSQRRLDQSRDSVFEKKFQDALRDTDTKQVELYSAWPQSTRVTNNLERVANEMIRDAIRRGEFSDLPGRGQPMMDTYQNPTLSSMEQKINVMLGDSGFLPDWIQLDREIRTHLEKLKGRILAEWNRCGPHPMSRSKAGEWEQNLLVFQQQLEVINKKIRERNLKGPLVGQKVNLKLDKVVSQVISGVLPRPSESEMKAPVERIAEAWDITFMSFVVATSTLLWVCLR